MFPLSCCFRFLSLDVVNSYFYVLLIYCFLLSGPISLLDDNDVNDFTLILLNPFCLVFVVGFYIEYYFYTYYLFSEWHLLPDSILFLLIFYIPPLVKNIIYFSFYWLIFKALNICDRYSYFLVSYFVSFLSKIFLLSIIVNFLLFCTFYNMKSLFGWFSVFVR